jgi:hypothetical protein
MRDSVCQLEAEREDLVQAHQNRRIPDPLALSTQTLGARNRSNGGSSFRQAIEPVRVRHVVGDRVSSLN